MKEIGLVQYFGDGQNGLAGTEWPLLKEKTQKEFMKMLDVTNTDDLRLIVGIEEQMEEIWEWREYFNEIEDLTEQANYKEEIPGEEVEGEETVIEQEINFGFVALVKFTFQGNEYKGILFQDASPAGIYIKKFSFDANYSC